ncbi:MAG: abortive infection family protein [Ruegeria sp.]
MERLKSLLMENLGTLPEFEYYLPIIDKALNYEQSRPDTSIECCNSLLQGFSKTIIVNLEGVEHADLDKPSEAKSDKLIKRALKCLKENDDVYEDDFATRGASLALAIASLRNARGDITHGKAVPKKLQSSSSLAEVTNEVTATILRYMFATYLPIKVAANDQVQEEPLEEVEEIAYEDNPDFNDYLDDSNPVEGKLLYSEGLFHLYLEDYEIRLAEYNNMMEELSSPDLEID